MPLVSVVIITYNRGNYINFAIQSVLEQNYSNYEIIVIDDASSDNTKDVLQDYINNGTIKYFRNEFNRGIVFNRNRGLELSSGKYIAVLDSDDLWCDKEKLQKQVEFLEKNFDYAVIGGNIITINNKGENIGEIKNEVDNKKIKNKILLKNQFANSSVLYSKDKIMELGGYDKEISGCELEAIEDYNLFLKIGKKWKMANLSEKVLKYRVHEGNVSKIKRLDLMKKNIFLVKYYGDFYPNKKIALIRRCFRYFIYKLLAKFL